MDRMTIHQVAQFLGRHPWTIRRLEDRNVLPPPKRDHNGWRYYTIQDMERIKAILYPDEVAS